MATYTGTGGKNDYTGTAEGDVIAGGGGADTLRGLGGDDYIASGDPADGFGIYGTRPPSLDTGAEHDVLEGGDGNDRIFAGYGDDVDGGGNDAYGDKISISFLGASSGITVDFSLSSQTIGGGTIQGFEGLSWVQGSNYDDVIRAEDNNSGYADFAEVFGMGGDDRIYAGYYTGKIFGGDGNDLLDGRYSQYLSEMHGGAGNDTLLLPTNGSPIAYGEEGDDRIEAGGEVHGGAGNDTIVMLPSYYRGYVYGDAGNDRIDGTAALALDAYGGAGSDTIIGSEGDDRFSGGSPPDLFTGDLFDDAGADKDVLAGMGGNDTIAAGIGDDADGGEGTDTLRLSLAGSAVGVTVSTAPLLSGRGTFLGGRIRGFESVAWLGGTGMADSFTIAREGAPQVLDAGAGNDTIVNRAANVMILGGSGDDVVKGFGGGFQFDGGEGRDTADFGSATRGVTVTLLDQPQGGFIGSEALLRNVEEVLGSAFRDRITGGKADDALTGGGGGDVLLGGGGKDLLVGGDGIDRLVGGRGNDTYVLSDQLDTLVEKEDGGRDRVVAAFDYVLGDNFEELLLNGTADLAGTGNDADNVLIGNAGRNILRGLAGNDVLVGKGGTDNLDGGEGSDTYVLLAADEQASAEIFDSGTGGTDTIRYAATAAGTYRPVAGNTGIEAIVIGTGLGLVADTSGTTAINLDASALGQTIAITGNAGVNVLTGTAFADTLNGGGGVDTLQGGKGDDTYLVDSTADILVEKAGEGRDSVVATVGWTLATNFEVLRLDGTAAIDGTGNGDANTIEGNEGANRLDGGSGDDVLRGMGGNDTLKGGPGADRLEGGAGNDRYIIEDSSDTLVEDANGGTDIVFASATVTLGANIEFASLTGAALANVTGNAADNLIGGSSAANTIDGGDGIDSLLGHGGNDILRGGTGDDFLYGGAGVDSLTGGAGSDTFIIGTAAFEGVDTITDFVSGTDKLLVINPYISGQLLAGGLVFGTSARDDDDIAIYDRSSGKLYVDYDANGSGGKVLLAQFAPNTVIAASDIQLILDQSFAQQIGPVEALLVL